MVSVLLRFWPIERGSQSSVESNQLLPLEFMCRPLPQRGDNSQKAHLVWVCVYEPISTHSKEPAECGTISGFRLRGRSTGASVACGMVIIQRRVGGRWRCLFYKKVVWLGPGESKRKLVSQSPDTVGRSLPQSGEVGPL